MNKYLKRDWNILIIMDALRYDVGYSYLKNSYHVEKFDSECCTTAEWYLKYWNNNIKNVVLISANARPFWKHTNFAYKNFTDSVKAWKSGIVDPNVTFDFFSKIYNKYGKDVRYLIHLIPPHLPFIGTKGNAFMKKLKGNDRKTNVDIYRAVENYGKQGNWDKLKMYYEESVADCLQKIAIKMRFFRKENLTVHLTSDHGELIGEGNRYDHPSNSQFSDILRAVPYVCLN